MNQSPYTPQSPGNAAAVSTRIAAFICPSNPNSSPISFTIPAGTDLDGSGPLPPTGAVHTMTNGGPLDYEAPSGVRAGFSNIAYAGTTFGNAREAWGTWDIAVIDVPSASSGGKGCRLRDLTDGTSNTILLHELTSRNALYRKRTLISPASDAEAAAQAATGSGPWADLFKGDTWVSGRRYDGIDSNGGPCAVNCSNARTAGLYSWHDGGAHILLADGSVRFISENIAQFTLASLFTKSQGEVFSDF